MTDRFHNPFQLDDDQEPETELTEEKVFAFIRKMIILQENEADVEETTTEITHSPGGRAISIFAPESYEENYAYPLVIWLHGHGGSEQDIDDMMAGISTQNYLGLSFRGNRTLASGYTGEFSWSNNEEAFTEFRDDLFETVRVLRESYHVHSERIFLAGVDAGADLALRLLLDRPEWFAGAFSIGGSLPQNDQPLARYRDLQGKQVLLASGSQDGLTPVLRMASTGRLLHTAGMNISSRVFDAGQEPTPEMLSLANEWVMGGICTAV
jgi:phospholipase/carboxylesterase